MREDIVELIQGASTRRGPAYPDRRRRSRWILLVVPGESQVVIPWRLRSSRPPEHGADHPRWRAGRVHRGARLLLSVALGMESASVIPGPSFGVAQRRPPWLSMMDRLTDRPIPMPSVLVV